MESAKLKMEVEGDKCQGMLGYGLGGVVEKKEEEEEGECRGGVD